MKLNRFISTIAAALAAFCFARADTSITGLPAAGSVSSSALVPVVDMTGTPTTKKATVAQLVGGLPAATSTNNGTMSSADKAKLDASTSSNTPNAVVQRDGSGNFAAQTITAVVVTGLSNPVNPNDAVNKAYSDASASGLTVKSPSQSSTTGTNVTLSGGAPNVIDGYTLHLNDRVLVKDQTDDTQNGIYYVTTLGTGANGTWTRATDADTGAKLVTGSYTFVQNGTTNGSSAWTMTTPGTITLGTSHISWSLFSQIGSIQASNIIGQLVNAQIADAALTFTKFASTIEPVGIVSSLPSPSGYTGVTVVFNTSDGKLYRYSGGAWTSAISSSDIPTGAITTTQISDNSISTPKLQANSVGASQIQANSISTSDLQANSVVAGKIAAAAVSTNELAANAVTASKILSGTIVASNIAALTITGANIAAGTLTADKMSVSSLSAITANLGTVTAGTLTASISITVGSGTGAVSITPSGMTIASGRITFQGDGTNPYIRVYGQFPYNGHFVELNGQSGSVGPYLQLNNGGGAATTFSTGASSTSVAFNFLSGAALNVLSGATLFGPGDIRLNSGDSQTLNVVGGEVGTGSVSSQIGYWTMKLNGRQVNVPIYNP